MKIRAGVNEAEKRKTTEKINVTKIWFFKKNSKMDKLLAILTKKKERRLKILE